MPRRAHVPVAVLALPLLMLAACGDKPDSQTASAPVVPGATPAVAPQPLPPNFPPEPGQPGGLPDDRRPLDESPYTPESPNGAGEVVQRYFGLIGDKKFDEARQLVGPTPPDLKQFTRKMSFYPIYRANIGRPGEIHGAAGSAYIEVPIQTYGRDAQGALFNRLETVTLRRSNMPDAKPEEKAWRIYQITVDQPAAQDGAAPPK